MKAAQKYNPGSTGSAWIEALGLQCLLKALVGFARLSPVIFSLLIAELRGRLFRSAINALLVD